MFFKVVWSKAISRQDSYEQAFKRADVNQLNNGGEVMSTLLNMLPIYSQIKNK